MATATPAAAMAAPTPFAAGYPSPASITRPPSAAPTALPRLKAPMLAAAAIVPALPAALPHGPELLVSAMTEVSVRYIVDEPAGVGGGPCSRTQPVNSRPDQPPKACFQARNPPSRSVALRSPRSRREAAARLEL
jgi:hypothetical protein